MHDLAENGGEGGLEFRGPEKKCRGMGDVAKRPMVGMPRESGTGKTAMEEANPRGDCGCASKPTWLMELNQSINQSIYYNL